MGVFLLEYFLFSSNKNINNGYFSLRLQLANENPEYNLVGTFVDDLGNTEQLRHSRFRWQYRTEGRSFHQGIGQVAESGL